MFEYVKKMDSFRIIVDEAFYAASYRGPEARNHNGYVLAVVKTNVSPWPGASVPVFFGLVMGEHSEVGFLISAGGISRVTWVQNVGIDMHAFDTYAAVMRQSLGHLEQELRISGRMIVAVSFSVWGSMVVQTTMMNGGDEQRIEFILVDKELTMLRVDEMRSHEVGAGTTEEVFRAAYIADNVASMRGNRDQKVSDTLYRAMEAYAAMYQNPADAATIMSKARTEGHILKALMDGIEKEIGYAKTMAPCTGIAQMLWEQNGKMCKMGVIRCRFRGNDLPDVTIMPAHGAQMLMAMADELLHVKPTKDSFTFMYGTCPGELALPYRIVDASWKQIEASAIQINRAFGAKGMEQIMLAMFAWTGWTSEMYEHIDAAMQQMKNIEIGEHAPFSLTLAETFPRMNSLIKITNKWVTYSDVTIAHCLGLRASSSVMVMIPGIVFLLRLDSNAKPMILSTFCKSGSATMDDAKDAVLWAKLDIMREKYRAALNRGSFDPWDAAMDDD